MNESILNVKKISILSLEDSVRDYEIICKQLVDSGLDFNITRVEGKNEFESSIRDKKYDIILADFKLPRFDAFKALHLCKQICPEVPFICVSEAIKEETVIELIKNGAVDYVLKESLKRLPIAVKRAFNELQETANRKKAEDAVKKNEKMYRTLTENIPDIVTRFDHDLKHIYINPVIEKITGVPPEEFLGRTNEDLGMPDEKVEIWNKNLNHVFMTGEQKIIEFDFESPDGNRYFSSKIVPEYENNGDSNKIDSVLTIARDITHYKHMIDSLRESQEQYRLLFDNSIDAILLTTPDGRVFSANHAACKIFQRTEEEIYRIGREGLVDNSDPRLSAALKERTLTGNFAAELTLIRANGTKFPAEVTSALFKDRHGQIKSGMIIRDITERKKAEERITKLNRINTVLSKINKAIVRTKDLQKLFDNICRIAVETAEFNFCWIGLIDKELNSIKPVAQCGNSKDNFEIPEIHISLENGKGLAPAATSIRNKNYYICNNISADEKFLFCDIDQVKKEYHSLAVFPLIRGEKVYGVINFYSSLTNQFDKTEVEMLNELTNDVSYTIETIEHNRQKQKIEEERDLLFNYSIDMMCVIGFDGYFKQANPSWTKTLKWTTKDLMSKTLLDFVHPEDRKSVIEIGNRLMRGEQIIENDLKRILCKDGTYKWLSWNLVTRSEENHVFAVTRDVTEFIKGENERKNLEAQLVQAQKLESLGSMAGGIAHDFNNILNIIMGYASLLKSRDFVDEEYLNDVDVILNTSRRGADLVKQLLTFARKSESVFQSVQINNIITEILKLFKETFPKTIEIKHELRKDLPPIIADSTQIHQVFLNLCVNARDAMEKGGTLTISTNLAESETIKKKFHTIESGRYIEVQISDTGSGMDESIRQKIFEPFFTTKGPGKGTGLGLALVYGIIKNHAGFIDIKSEPGKGTSFYIYLSVQEQGSQIYQDILKTEDNTIPKGSGTILLIEDEENSSELMTTILVLYGYKVITAYDGMQGVLAFQDHKKEITAVVTDLGLPRLNGEEVIKQIKTIDPGSKIILISGYIDPEIKARLLETGIKHFIQKPYMPDKILQTLKDILEE